MSDSKHTPGPWEYVPSCEAHGAYVMAEWGGTVCDFYVMTDPGSPSVRNGGTSQPRPLEDADANARLCAAAPELLTAAYILLAFADQNGICGGFNVRALIAKAEGRT